MEVIKIGVIMKFILNLTLLVLSLSLSNIAFAINDNQILVCPSCSKSEAENMAISNRYGRTSDISVINDADWSVYTFRVKDYSEPGTSLIQA